MHVCVSFGMYVCMCELWCVCVCVCVSVCAQNRGHLFLPRVFGE